MKFGGKKIWVHVPDNAVCEVSGKVLARKHLEEGMRLELSELDAFGVASVLGEAEARKKAVRRIHTTRWVLTEKPSVSNLTGFELAWSSATLRWARVLSRRGFIPQRPP